MMNLGSFLYNYDGEWLFVPVSDLYRRGWVALPDRHPRAFEEVAGRNGDEAA